MSWTYPNIFVCV